MVHISITWLPLWCQWRGGPIQGWSIGPRGILFFTANVILCLVSGPGIGRGEQAGGHLALKWDVVAGTRTKTVAPFNFGLWVRLSSVGFIYTIIIIVNDASEPTMAASTVYILCSSFIPFLWKIRWTGVNIFVSLWGSCPRV